MREIDVDELVETNATVIFAVDQTPFEHDRSGILNVFCVLTPLMTQDGRRFENLPEQFPKRGRVWWMLRSDLPREEIRPGVICSAEIELAPRAFEDRNPDKDRYQVKRHSLQLGNENYLEIIDVEADDPDPAIFMRDAGLPMNHRTLNHVLLRGQNSCVGPFKASWDSSSARLKLSTLSLSAPVVRRIKSLDLVTGRHVFEFRYEANRWYHQAPLQDIVIRLAAKDAVKSILESGEEIDAATDQQVVKWALDQLKLTRKQTKELRESLVSLELQGDGQVPHLTSRVARFRQICSDSLAVLDLGQEVAEVLGRQPAFRDLLDRHIDSVTRDAVAEQVAKRREAIESEITEAERRKQRLGEELKLIEQDYDRKKVDQEERLESEHKSWLQTLRVREDDVAEREHALVQREEKMSARLADAIRDYESGADELARRIVSDLPVLRRLGLGVVSSGAQVASEGSNSSPVGRILPPWLERSVEHGLHAEETFIDQLAAIAAHRGFVYSLGDLVNFHVAVKTGTWTVLAGPTGLGKSSLPRIYAEALGASSEFLTIPVRPDWLDDRDVIGAFNSLAGRYEPAATGLVDHLIAAQEDATRSRGGIYLVCLDEMNLARVEHYLAQLLSIMEEPADRRMLTLYGQGVERAGEPYSRHRRLQLGANIRFVGTVNVDETTHFFSPKVLDRMAVVTFEIPDLSRDPGPRLQARELAVTPVHLDEYRSWVRGPEQAPQRVRELVLELDRRLRPMRSGLGYRLRDRLLSHVASSIGLISEDRACDLAISCTVLPKIRVHDPRFAGNIGALIELLPEKRFPRCGSLLEAMNESGVGDDFFKLL